MKLPRIRVVEDRINHDAAGEKIRQLRLSKKMSLRSLAKKMNMSAPFLSDLERGNRNWSEERFDLAVKMIG